MTSHHPMDVANRYCAQCRMFHDTGLRYVQELPTMSDELNQRYLDAIKANADVAILNTTLETELQEARRENAALRARLDSCMQKGDMALAESARLRSDVCGATAASGRLSRLVSWQAAEDR
jgi:hypothetical protein